MYLGDVKTLISRPSGKVPVWFGGDRPEYKNHNLKTIAVPRRKIAVV